MNKALLPAIMEELNKWKLVAAPGTGGAKGGTVYWLERKGEAAVKVALPDPSELVDGVKPN